MKWPVLKYKAIYADPPWRFKHYSTKGMGRSAQKHYDCLTLDKIKELPIDFCAAEDCVLFLWVTDPMLQEGLELIRSWGFEYKTVAFTWVKENTKSDSLFTGMGYWTRSNPEMCLLATRGKPSRIAKDVRQVIVSKRREHSRKPDEVYERIERLVAGPYLELFARQSNPGWDSWGNEIDKFSKEAT